MPKLTVRAIAAAIFCLLAPLANAQITQIPGTGCLPNPQYPATTGTGQANTTISVTTICPREDISVAIVAGRSVPVTLPLGLACVPNCVLHHPTDFTWVGLHTWADTVQPAWVGTPAYMQYACWDRTNLCLTLSGALQINFTP